MYYAIHCLSTQKKLFFLRTFSKEPELKVNFFLFHSANWLSSNLEFEELEIVAEPDNKFASCGVPQFLSHIENNLRNGFTSILMLETPIQNTQVGLIFKPLSPFYEMMNVKTMELVESGLIGLWIQKKTNGKLIRRVIEEIGPQVLTMDHLEIGFLVCSVPLMLSVMVFILELIWRNSRRK